MVEKVGVEPTSLVGHIVYEAKTTSRSRLPQGPATAGINRGTGHNSYSISQPVLGVKGHSPAFVTERLPVIHFTSNSAVRACETAHAAILIIRPNSTTDATIITAGAVAGV